MSISFCNPMACSPPGYSVHGISQAKILEWVTISFFRGSSSQGIKPTLHASYFGDQILYHWATWKAQLIRKKMHSCSKGRSKTYTIADDMILYTENPKDSTKKAVGLINEFSTVAGYKIKIQKYVASLYANNKLSGREIKKTIKFIIVS